MEYNITLPLSFEQLLNLTLQLPKVEQKRLINSIENKTALFPTLEMKTVAEVQSKAYQYPHKNIDKLVGIWENDEEIENLLK